MKAHELKKGDVFTVDPPDLEHPERVCLYNDDIHGLRWGWPNDDRFWSWMGGMCEVTLVRWEEP